MSDKIGQILVTKKVIHGTRFERGHGTEKREPKKYLGQILCGNGSSQSKIIKGFTTVIKENNSDNVLVELNINNRRAVKPTNLLKQKDLKSRGIYTPLGTLLTKTGLSAKRIT